MPIVLADGVSKFFFARVALVSAGKNIILRYNLQLFAEGEVNIVDNPRDEVEGIIGQYSLSLTGIIVLV